VLCAAGVCAYVATRLVAFPLLADDVGNWAEPLGLVCIVAETAVVVLVAVSMRRATTPPAVPSIG
jgi:FtsH-binding integral membrane protein